MAKQRKNRERTPLTDLEQAIALKYSGASFPPGTAAKRFSRDLSSGQIQNLSDNGRAFLAYLVNRYRRQYRLTPEEQAWVDQWRNWTPPPASVEISKEIKENPVLEQPQCSFDFK